MELLRQFSTKLEERYSRLYGGKDCSKKVSKIKKDLLVISAVLLMTLCVALVIELMTNVNHPNELILGHGEEVLQVKRPSAEEGASSFNFQAEVITKEGTVVEDMLITIEPMGKKKEETGASPIHEKTAREKTADELRLLISKLNVDTAEETIELPQQLGNGDTVIWKRADSSNIPLYLIGVIGAMLWLYKIRFYAIEKEEKQAAESIMKELPEFINKIVLLMNAGIVLNTAFLKIMEERSKSGCGISYFYGQLDQIQRSMKEANGSFHIELREFAKRSRIKELMRVANIISDNVCKGVDLADKLRKENELLWFARKQQSEEKGKLAETKLTLPLMILLLVLIMITIAPALMGM